MVLTTLTMLPMPVNSLCALPLSLSPRSVQWFIERGNKKGVPFGETIDFFRTNFETAQANYDLVSNPTIEDDYKSYYTQTFHGYETGNLSWEAAEDCLGATLSMSLSYWPKNRPMETASWFRGNFTQALTQYCDEHSPHDISQKIKTKSSSLNMLDVAGSIGVSTKVLLDEFENAKVGLVDLSPYFLSTAKMLLETKGSPIYDASATQRVSYQHAYAEDMPYASNSLDIVTVSFLIHELPPPVIRQVMEEAYRVLKPGGVLAILDLDASTVKSLPPLRRFLFEVSEPHIHQYTSAKTNVHEFMKDAGFQHTTYEMNDPMNARWIGQKPPKSDA
uniref:Methyltransferase type 11 domain-containing protein n=1 Tax=Grammatophora oceanica TaxID=210454 RepID=A0A7S1UV11_9STRA|mmetsp:Transcript_2460/g.3335  ORF Transcript_2460/g.3335 Transcript_2460/m.3335 type:complete len:333 (+) Transcript_2460:213-1211(+)